jgi:hypothetical protein
VLVYFESDNMIHKGGGFSFQHTEVASAQEVEGGCQLGFFGFKCDTQVCFGSSSVAVGGDGSTQVSDLLPAAATNLTGRELSDPPTPCEPARANSSSCSLRSRQVASGTNPPAGVNCAWDVTSTSDVEALTVVFEKLHLEPNSDDMIKLIVGSEEHTRILGVASTCSKSLDCNKLAGQTTGKCVFASDADVFGVCKCEEGWHNGDCSVGAVVLEDAAAGVTIVYETDINDIRTTEVVEWQARLVACGGSTYAKCATDEGGKGGSTCARERSVAI